MRGTGSEGVNVFFLSTVETPRKSDIYSTTTGQEWTLEVSVEGLLSVSLFGVNPRSITLVGVID